jgi:hypothetical protein
MGDHRIAGVPCLGMDASHPGFFGKARLLQEVSAVTAACMFVRKADFKAVGMFEENLRVAYNDIDLCLKITALGRKILVDPDITLIHKESRTRGSDKHGIKAKRLKKPSGCASIGLKSWPTIHIIRPTSILTESTSPMRACHVAPGLGISGSP